MTKQMAENRNAFAQVVEKLEIENFEYRGRTEKGFLFSDENDHFVTVSITAHKWETPTTAGYDGLGMLEQYDEKQVEKESKKMQKEMEKAKKMKEKAKKMEEKAKK